MLGRLRIPLLDVFGIVMSIALLISHDSLLGDPGVGWHLKSGEWISNHLTFPSTDPFLAAPAGSTPRPWVHDQWLSDVILWQIYSFGGIPGLHALCVAVCVGTFLFVLAPLGGLTGASDLAIFLVLVLVAFIGSLQWFVRPVIFSFLFFALAYRGARFLLSTEKIPRRAPAAAAAFFAFWANMHGAFWLGLFLLAATCLELVWRGRISKTFGATTLLCALVATLVNPWGLQLWKSTLGLGLDPYFTHLNREWLSPDLLDGGFFPFVLALFLLIFGACSGKKSRPDRFDWMLVLPLLVLSLIHRRYLPFLSLVLFVPLLRFYPGERWRKLAVRATGRPWCTAALWCLLFGFSFLFRTIPLLETYTTHFPRSLPDAELETIRLRPGPVFHSPDLGGYITWKLWPSVKATIDDRNQLVGRAPYEEFFKIARVNPGWDEALKRENFSWALLGSDYPLRWVLEARSDWKKYPVAAGSDWVLFEKIGQGHPE